MIKLLLTSGGITNPSIQNALVELLGKPIAEANALCITTASYGHPWAGPPRAWSFISGRGDDETLGVVDFSIFPHLDHPMLKWNTLANAEKWAAEIAGPAYAIDDETAIKVVDGTVEVISEGHWTPLNR